MAFQLTSLPVCIRTEALYEQAAALAEKLHTEVTVLPPEDGPKNKSAHFPEETALFLSEEGLFLTKGTLSMQGDFSHLAARLRTGNLQQEMLVKAARIKGVPDALVLDATAGMGEDSMILASAGFRVQLYEYDPVIAALLEDALTRSLQDPALAPAVLRMELHAEDSVEAMKQLPVRPDVILLDPMFPARTKSALIKKKFQLLHELEQPCENEEELLEAALFACPKKIVIKRPLKGPYLAGRKPDYSLTGKAIRYDCILPHA